MVQSNFFLKRHFPGSDGKVKHFAFPQGNIDTFKIREKIISIIQNTNIPSGLLINNPALFR
jgi:hypothetical protein